MTVCYIVETQEELLRSYKKTAQEKLKKNHNWCFGWKFGFKNKNARFCIFPISKLETFTISEKNIMSLL